MFKVTKQEYITKTLRINKLLYERLAENAAQNGISMNALVVQCCEYALDTMNHEEDGK